MGADRHCICEISCGKLYESECLEKKQSTCIRLTHCLLLGIKNSRTADVSGYHRNVIPKIFMFRNTATYSVTDWWSSMAGVEALYHYLKPWNKVVVVLLRSRFHVWFLWRGFSIQHTISVLRQSAMLSQCFPNWHDLPPLFFLFLDPALWQYINSLRYRYF